MIPLLLKKKKLKVEKDKNKNNWLWFSQFVDDGAQGFSSGSVTEECTL